MVVTLEDIHLKITVPAKHFGGAGLVDLTLDEALPVFHYLLCTDELL